MNEEPLSMPGLGIGKGSFFVSCHYSPGCMDKRNRYMVDHADSIIVTDPVTLAVERL